MATETKKPTPSDICLSTATDQAKGNSGTNKSAKSSVSISNVVTGAGGDPSDATKVTSQTTTDRVSVEICNATGEPKPADGGCGCA
jgi:hypothetical protein